MARKQPFASIANDTDVVRARVDHVLPVDIQIGQLNVPEVIRALIQRCWKEPMHRPPVSECLARLLSLKYPDLVRLFLHAHLFHFVFRRI